MEKTWERRWHPLLKEWVLLATVTTSRPWSGNVIKENEAKPPKFDPNCYLCPNVKRPSGNVNADYQRPYVFNNDYPSLCLDKNLSEKKEADENLFEKRTESKGICKVVCFSPYHDLTLAEMSKENIINVLKVLKEEYLSLSQNKVIKNVLIFENKGKEIGVSNPHPHGQIYSTNFIPKIIQIESESQNDYFKKHSSNLFDDLIAHEQNKKQRIILENEHFIAFIPFFARFVYETYLVAKRNVAHIGELTNEELESLSDIYSHLLIKFDNLYQMSFPNITILRNIPTCFKNGEQKFRFHFQFYPPMRSQDKLKYLAGFESGGGNIINPTQAEVAASYLRESPIKHYKLA